MRFRLPPKQVFPHAISYNSIDGEDDWGKPIFSNPIELPHARIDEGYDFKRQGINATENAPNALVVIFKQYNPDMPILENEGIVNFNGKEFTIVKAIPLYFMSDEIIGYELEVK
jgi:hypothetical protein